MNISRFFIFRPIAAIVLSALIVIAGALSLGGLPLTEYPRVTPPTVVVRAAYPGANPRVIAETVAAPLEQEINGVEGMLYMSSQAAGNGALTVTVTFEAEVDADLAQVQVQNRVSRAIPRLPQEVQRIGITTQKSSPDILMVVHLLSPGGRHDPLYLSNYATLRVKDELARIPGVGDVLIFGAGEYSLRVWLDPAKVAARSLTAGDVVSAIREQNVQVAAGAVGQQPSAGNAFQLAVNATGRLSDPEEFEDIIVRVSEDGGVVRIRDLGRVEMGSNQYAIRSLLDNQPAAAIQILQDPKASAIEVSTAVRAAMDQLAKAFPEGVQHRIVYDPTIFVRASIRNVALTLFEATGLVVLVVLLFLQTWRASFIPVIAVPVSLIGTFAVMHLFGFTLNTLSLFGLVLSIGIVVDDAIVVVENVERHIGRGLRPRDAALAAMSEVTSPILAITAVLCAVFIPTAFMGGLSGQFYRQFALTIAISTVLSAINSLTLSPALAALMLKGHSAPKDWLTRVLDRTIGPITHRFNALFDRAGATYVSAVGRAMKFAGVTGVVYAGLLGLTALGFGGIATGFVPSQDKYYLVGIAQLPNGASLDRTEAVVKEMTRLALAQPGVESVVAFPGLSINGFVANPNAAVLFAMLDPFESRTTGDLGAFAIAGALNGKFASIGGAMAAMFPPPPVPGLGTIGGFKLQIQDRAAKGERALFEATQKVTAEAWKSSLLAGVFSSYQVDVPQLFFDLDRERAKQLAVPLDRVFEALQVYLGSLYVNDFNTLGRTYPVTVQADQAFRIDAENIGELQVRGSGGAMVPLAALATIRPDSGPDSGPDPVSRYNAYVAADINGGPAAGVSSGEAVAEMTRILDATLPEGFTYEWTDLTYQQMREGNGAVLVFALAVLLAYLLLAAQYNSWTIPLSVMVVIPTVLLSAIAGLWLAGRDNNIFTQIGLVVLIGLAAKNAILIVEFARQRESEGSSAAEAILEACRLRLRPVLMTSLAFIMGVAPLVLATGAGAEMRQAMGLAVFSGMLGVTLFGLILTPVAYHVVRTWRRPAFKIVPKRLAAALGIVVSVSVSGAACAARYEAKVSTIAAPASISTQGTVDSGFESTWWTQFKDPVLDGLIADARRANRDLRAAISRYEAARELAGASSLERLPQIDAAFGAARRRPSAVEAGGSRPERAISIAQAGLDLTWELDLFGRLGKKRRAAAAEASASGMDARGVEVAILAQVAAAYFELRGAEQELSLAETLKSGIARQIATTTAMLEAGRVTRLDLLRAQQVEEELVVAVSAARHRAERARLRLATLTGRTASGWRISEEKEAPLRTAVLSIGTPAEMLRRRPDIAAAELRVAAATENAGAARAELFPSIEVTGAFGLVAGSVGRLAESASQSWFVAPRLIFRALDWPRLRREMRAKGALADAAFAAYEQTVLAALEESQIAVDAYAAASRELEASERRARDAAEAARIVAVQHEEGLVDSLTRTLAERDGIAGALEANRALTTHRLAVVDVYRALGGGWR